MAKAIYVRERDFKHAVDSAAAGGTNQFPVRDKIAAGGG